ncbi:MAG: cellulase family glycosylhydrolase [Victivallaceae bacterium]|nr:cellulase family glycosylhydrolase [Victivallaceae bacterium]
MQYFFKIAAFLAVLTVAAGEPEFTCRSNAPGNIQFAAEPVRLELKFENRGAFSGDVTELVRVTDFYGNGDAPEQHPATLDPKSVLKREISIPAERKGPFLVTYSLLKDGELVFCRNISGAVLDPVKAVDPEGSPIGMYCHNVQWNGKTELPILRNMGISWVRANLSWGRSEPERGKYDWKQGDASDRVLNEYGMHIMYNLVYPPRWAVTRVNIYGGNPADFADFAAFAARAVARYPKVLHWSVWNEPDAESHWEGGGAEYARLLKAVAPAVRAANPAVKILPGGVTGSAALAERFMRDLNAGGGRPFFDIYEYHYKNLELHRKLMKEFGWKDMPLWNTEEATGTGKSAQLVHDTVSGLACGVERTFLFLYTIRMTRPEEFEEFGPVVMVDNDGRPTERFPVVYTMGRELNGIRDCRDVSQGAIRLYSYRNGDGKPRYVLWSDDGKTRAVTLKSSGSLRAVDAAGNAVRLTPFDGFVSVPASEVTYLDGAEVIPAGRPMAEIGTPRDKPVFGSEFEIPVRFYNPGVTAFRGRALLAASPDWEIAKAEIPLELAPGTAREVVCRLKPRGLTDCTKSRLVLNLSRENGELTAYDFRDIELATPLDFSLASAFRWGEPRVRAAIANPTASPVMATIRFHVPGEAKNVSSMPLTLPPLTTSYVFFDPKLAAGKNHGNAEAALTYPGGTIRHSAALDWIAVKSSGNPPVRLRERANYSSPSRILFQWGGPDDLSAEAHLEWNAQYLTLSAVVTDDVHSAESESGLLWQRDSMQIWFDGMLFDLGLMKTGAALFRHDSKSENMKISFSVVREGNTTRYKISFPNPKGGFWRENDTAKLAFIINDADQGAERKGWLYYLSDIGDPRCRATAPEITLVK